MLCYIYTFILYQKKHMNNISYAADSYTRQQYVHTNIT